MEEWNHIAENLILLCYIWWAIYLKLEFLYLFIDFEDLFDDDDLSWWPASRLS